THDFLKPRNVCAISRNQLFCAVLSSRSRCPKMARTRSRGGTSLASGVWYMPADCASSVSEWEPRVSSSAVAPRHGGGMGAERGEEGGVGGEEGKGANVGIEIGRQAVSQHGYSTLFVPGARGASTKNQQLLRHSYNFD